MMKYGFEKEYFLVTAWEDGYCWSSEFNQKCFRLCPDSVPKDECGYLAEARGEPHENPVAAAYLMMADEHKVREKASLHGLSLLDSEPTVKLPRKLFREALRKYGKPGYSDQRHNMYGLDYSVNNSWNRAALHIHFSNTTEFYHKDENKNVFTKILHHPIDMCKYILALDKAFAKEIKESKRLPGFYEMKQHGFEYRSLPTSVDPIKVAEVIAGIK